MSAPAVEQPGLDMLAERGLHYHARDIRKSFSGVEVLKGVSLDLAQGEVHSLLGANGAGKSTLLKIMSGIYSSDGGELLVDGRVLPPLTPAKAQQASIYLVPQEPRVMPELSIAENIFLGIQPRGRLPWSIAWRSMNAQAAVLLETVGVDRDPRDRAGTLPLALQQLLECARALAHRCGVILFDEPTSPLTGSEVSRLFGLIGQLRDRGLTLAFISHRMDEIEEISDRLTVLRDGQVVASAARGEMSRSELTDAMIGHAVVLARREPRQIADAPPILEVTGLRAAPKVRDISVSVRPGEIVGLAGLVGSGRTEFCEAVFGLRAVDAGTVTVAGADLTRRSPRQCIAAGMVYLAEDRGRDGIFSDVNLVWNATSAIVDRLPSTLRLLNRRVERQSARESLDLTSVQAASVDIPIRSLSGGNQQKVLFSRWIAAEPKVALFDEPTRGVDVGAKEGIYQIVEHLAHDGVGVVVVSSELEELVRLCDRVYAVFEGMVVGELVGDEIELDVIGRMAVNS